MNFGMCESLLRHLDDGSLRIGQAPQPTQDWLRDLNLPRSLCQIMRYHWVQDDCSFSEFEVFSSKSIQADEFTPTFLSHSFLYIGDAGNGDWLAIDFATEACQPGLVSHEECAHEDGDNPREYFEPIAKSFEGLLYRIDEGRFIPVDYFQAHDYNEIARQEDSTDT